MSLNTKQNEQLLRGINPKRVLPLRGQSHLAGWDVKAHLTRIFGFEGWDKKMVTPWFEFTGLATDRHDIQLPIAITFVDKESPITKDMKDWTTVNEELYNNFTGKLQETAQPLARGKQTVYDRQRRPKTSDYVVVWTNNYHGTKVFATTLGHNNATVADTRYLDLVTRGLLWSVDKLDEAHLKPAKKVLLDD